MRDGKGTGHGAAWLSSGPKKRLGLSLPLLALGLGRAGPPLDTWQGQSSQGEEGCISWLGDKIPGLFLFKETVPRKQSVNDP